ncbi:MAG: 2-oxo acid dehydrogenase subunit E2 [Bacteroidia bacterium]|nr:2-oxo acid dehydrogenase subunit E2 [Bacteroidia bacterium]
MARIEMVMPKMGESIMEGTVIRWLKKVGDRIEAEESILEIATDKVDSEVPSPASGILTEILAKEGDVIPVGNVIAIIQTEIEEPVNQPKIDPVLTQPQPVLETVATTANPTLTASVLSVPVSGRFYSPLVLNIAKEERISMDELDRIPGTGSEGRVTKKDILQYLEARKAGNIPVSAPQQPVSQPIQPTVSTPIVKAEPIAVEPPTQKLVFGESSNGASEPPKKKSFSYNGAYDIIEMDRMRKMIAENMVYSKHTSPHVTSFVEVDVTNVVLWREKVKEQFEKKYGEKLTFTPIFIEALCKTLRDYPMVNISVDGDKIIVKKDLNIGVAVALPSGNLIVPTLRKADRLNLAGLAAGVNDLANRARNNKLNPDDLSDGTYTLSNVGVFGSVMGTPIILQPQCAVMATGTIAKKPAVLETPTGDVIAIRHLMMISHSYDHRVIDGMLGGKFAKRFAEYLENWDINREI